MLSLFFPGRGSRAGGGRTGPLPLEESGDKTRDCIFFSSYVFIFEYVTEAFVVTTVTKEEYTVK